MIYSPFFKYWWIESSNVYTCLGTRTHIYNFIIVIIILLHSHNHDTYIRGNIVNTIMTSETQFFKKIYTSHFIRKGYERVMREKWVGDWTKTATYWPPVPLSFAAFLSRSTGLLNRGSRGRSSLLGLVLTASNCNNWLQTPN